MIELTGDSRSHVQTANSRRYIRLTSLRIAGLHMPHPFPLLFSIVLAVTALGETQAWAGHADKPAVGKDSTLPDSVRRVERETGGQVLRAQPIERDGREVYRVKVLTPQGRVRVMENDAGSPRAPVADPLPAPTEHGHHR